MKQTHLLVAAAVTVLLASTRAEAQVPPFFNGGGGIFDPEISVVQSGVLLDAQAVVSADRKYVTLNMRAQNAELLALREFAFQTGAGGAGGQVGGAAASNGVARGAAGVEEGEEGDDRRGRQSRHDVPRTPYPTPEQIRSSDRTPILQKEGMTLVSRVASSPSSDTKQNRANTNSAPNLGE